ncbi:unnamed protein product [Polarella glacialis]|uniref:Uncharacterized protein n=1 Tax=Polarella glacialis TaxID=89957 RepID=A0A813DWG9_POLGL|nr:unnamed protein product [Polarella glacialis]|mmetsp:Transcript_65273/g.105499  ORF Transcript_65273/g.105499 Transcript_65273/m.105499 type:complete len:226 (-) Transcript_65273:112-789(-)
MAFARLIFELCAALLVVAGNAQFGTPPQSASGTSGGMFSGVSSMLSKLMGGGTGTGGSKLPALCQSNPQSCCQASSCWTIPGLGCTPDRNAKCVGTSIFNPHGVCQCPDNGYCGDGKCKSAGGAITGNSQTSSASNTNNGFGSSSGTSNGFGNSFGRLYDAAESQAIPPEDHTVVLMGYAAFVAGFVMLGAVVIRRLRHKAERSSQQGELELLQDPEEELAVGFE